MRLPIILTDIEGTTSSISFVKDVLFPYARDRLPAFVRAHARDPQVRHWLAEAARESSQAGADDEALIRQLLRWIDEDRKLTPLKALQGMIWASGYDGRDFVAHVYPDALANLRRWHAAGHPIYVYSSGSVPAQKLYFSHTEAGDLSALFSGYFDTTTGPKRDADSYAAIAEAVGRPSSDFLFLSDVDAELDAAREAGMRTVWLRRDLADTAQPPRADHPVATTFDAITV